MSKIKAQGTIEYLVIIAIVVVIALVVVSILTGFLETGTTVDSQSNEISRKTQALALNEIIQTPNGETLLELKLNDQSNISVQNIQVNDDQNNFNLNNDLTLGSKKYFKITSSNCEEGNTITKDIIITYTNEYGLTKTQKYENITIECQQVNLKENTSIATYQKEEPTTFTWYFDEDGDGYSNGTTQENSSDPGSEWYLEEDLIDISTIDCNDNNPTYNISCPECITNSDCETNEICIFGETDLNNICQDGVIQYLKFDEGTGNTTTDLSGNGHNATIYGANWDTTGRLGNSINLDSGSEYISLAAGSLAGYDTGTLSMWVYSKEANLGKYLFGYSVNATDGVGNHFRINSTTGNIEVYLGGDGVQNANDHRGYFQTEQTIPQNEWTHIILTWDLNESRVYVNGAPAGSGYDYTNSFRLKSAMTGSPQVGKHYTSTSYTFFGEIDEFIAFEKELSEIEIKNLYLSQGGDNSCSNKTCQNYCVGKTRYYSGNCTDGNCNYQSEECTDICAEGVCYTTPTGAWSTYTSQRYIPTGSGAEIAHYIGPSVDGADCVTQCSQVPGAGQLQTYTNNNSNWCICYAGATPEYLGGWYDRFTQQR